MVSRVRFKNVYSLALVVFLGALTTSLGAQTTDPASETLKRWVTAKSIKGAFSWKISGTLTLVGGTQTVTRSESGSGTLTLVPSDATDIGAVFEAIRNLAGSVDQGTFELPYNFAEESRLAFPCSPGPGTEGFALGATGGGNDGGIASFHVSRSTNGLPTFFLTVSVQGTAQKVARVFDCDGSSKTSTENAQDQRSVGGVVEGELTRTGPLTGTTNYTDGGIQGTVTWALTPDSVDDDKNIDNDCKQSGGSTVSCENQTLAEDISIVGAPFTLHYESDRVRGRQESNDIAKTLAAHVGGWSISLHHAYDPATNRLYMGTGQRRDSVALGSVSRRADGTYLIASVDARQIYVFGSNGQHLRTRDALTGTDTYRFSQIPPAKPGA